MYTCANQFRREQLKWSSPLPQFEIVVARFDAAGPGLVLVGFRCWQNLVHRPQRYWHKVSFGKRRTRLPPLIKVDDKYLMLARLNNKGGGKVHCEDFISLQNAAFLPVGSCDLERDSFVSPAIPIPPDCLRLLGDIGKHDVEVPRLVIGHRDAFAFGTA